MNLIFAGKVEKGKRGFQHGKFDRDDSNRRDAALLDQHSRLSHYKKLYEYPVISANNKMEDGFKVIRGTQLNKDDGIGNVRNMFYQPLAKKHIDSQVTSVIPIGIQTEVTTAVEAVKELFPHTLQRLPKETMRNHLFQK